MNVKLKSFLISVSFFLIYWSDIILATTFDTQKTSVGRDSTSKQKVINFSLSAGSINGMYYSIGGTICRLVNKDSAKSHLKCSLEATPATIFNLNMLREGKTDFAISQGDWEYYAYYGQKYFEKFAAFKQLRMIFSMHQEIFTLVVKKNSPIEKLNDIVGKRVNLNGPGSGVNASFNAIMTLKKWQKNDFKLLTQLREAEQGQALCDGKVDIIGYFVGHPSAALQELSATCDIKIIPIGNDTDIKKMITQNSFYFATIIPGGIYAGIDQDINSYGVYANLLTRADVDDNLVYLLTKAVFENISSLRLSHKLLHDLNPKKMSINGYSAPLHNGAKKYYLEKGFIKN